MRARIVSSARALAVLAVPLLLPAGQAAASSPATWEYPAREAAPAKLDGIAVGESGALTLSSPLREIFPGGSKITPPPILWSAVLDQDGGLYIGTGNSGELLRVEPAGTASTWADTEELGVRSVAVGARGDLFMATFPTGGVYRIRATGEASPFFDPEDRYIWSLASDGAGQLFVATGERGIIYRVTGEGEGKPFFDSDQTHVTSLAVDPNGGLLAGTAPSGLLYRISPSGKAELLLDTDMGEISSVAVGPGGTIYASAIGEEPIQPPARPGEKSDLRIEVTPAADGNVLEEPADLPRKITIDLTELMPARAGGVAGTAGRLYRIEPGRAPELIWKSDSERIYSLAWSPGRGLLFGAGGPGSQGLLYRVELDGSATLLHRMAESQVTALAARPDGRVYVCTSNPGRIYALDPGATAAGRFLSSVYDAGVQALWGAIAWGAETPPGTRVELSTRSGNRPDPDASWSDWTPPYAVDAGSRIASPSGRYIQWKAELSRLKTEATPLLRQVKVTLLPENRPPTLRALAVHPAGAPLTEPRAEEKERSEKEKGAEGAGRKEPPKGTRWVSWSAADPDGDTLSHTVWLKGPAASSSDFTRVATGIAASPWALPESQLLEGRYLLKIEVDDAATNGAGQGLTDSLTAEPFTVDHTSPRLESRRSEEKPAGPGRLLLDFTATDQLSPIARGEFTQDPASGPWTPLSCRDGICDTSSEVFRLDVAAPAPGTRITIRVIDAAGNTATIEAPGSDR